MTNRFAKRLGDYRVFAGETQQELADAIHVKVRTLQTWEQGVHNCSFDDLIAICEHYQISSDWLIGIIPEDSPLAARVHTDQLTQAERKSLMHFEEFLLNKHRKE